MFSKDVFGDNPNLWTIILSQDEKEIIFSCLEKEEKGTYAEIKQVELDKASWKEKALNLIQNRQLDELKEYLNDIGQKEYNIIPGVIKIANIKFFQGFYKAFLEYENTNDLLLYILQCMEWIKVLFENDWLILSPSVPLFTRLKELVTNVLDIHSVAARKFLSSVLIPFNYAFAIQDKDKNFMAVIKAVYQNNSLSISMMDQSELEQFKTTGFRVLGNHVRREFEYKPLVISLRLEPLKKLFLKFLNTPLPHTKENSYKFLADIIFFIRSYGKVWNLSPEPQILTRRARNLLRSLGVRYSINNLAYWFIPNFIFTGLAFSIGWKSNICILILDRDHLLSGFSVLLINGSVRKIKCLETDEISSLFKGIHLKDIPEALKDAKLKLWKKGEGDWYDLMVSVQKSYLTKTLDGIFNHNSPQSYYHLLVQQILITKKVVLHPELSLWKLFKAWGVRKTFTLIAKELFDKPANAYMYDHGEHIVT